MSNALFYLQYRQLANLARITLRTPKRLIPVVLGVIYLLFFTVGQVALHSMDHGMRRPMPMMMPSVDAIQSGLLFLAIMLSLSALHRAFSESMIIFTPAEMDVLISMPIKRRTILAIKLAGVYAKFGVYIAFIGVFTVPQMMVAFGTASPILALVGWLAMVLYAATIVNLATVINLIVACSNEDKWWQKTLVRGLIIGLLLLASVTVYSELSRTGSIVAAIAALVRQPVLIWLAAPAVWATGLAVSVFRGWQPAFAWQLGLLAALAYGTMAMVLARKENPYEPSLAVSTRTALIRRAIKSGGMAAVRAELMRTRKRSSAPTLIPPFGRGATAILWKNMVGSMRTSRSGIIGAVILLPALALVLRLTIRDKGLFEFAPEVMTGAALYVSWIMSMVMQQTLRADLKQVNILKPMPISPWWLMVAETANAGLMVWGFVWLLFGSAIFILGAPASSQMIISGLSLPFVAYASICSQTTVAVLYPNWQDISQQWIANLLSMGLSALSIGPPVAIGVIMWYVHVPPAIAAPVVIATALALALGGITLGAATYRRHDPTGE